ncbi:hypothetical protein [Actinomyces qiguomingii]|uniref:hypothetical protein n=1 Tax=Actinomyces qiguomingii TaxID=2057800 RepID=UPI000FFEE2E6|nr:hypothetical protein [Actinomyces qiguomingii]
MAEVRERRREAVGARSAVPVAWYLIALAVLMPVSAWSIVLDDWFGDENTRASVISLFMLVFLLVVGTWVHKRTPARQRVILRIAENNSAVVLVSLAVVVWLGWGEVPPILAGVLGAAPSLNSLWGLRALRKAAA